MKTFTTTFTTFALVLLLSLSAFAQTSTPAIDEIGEYPAEWQEWISTSLEHETSGVIESAIFHVAKFKMRHPERSTDDLQDQLEELVEDGPTAVIRYKSAIALRYLEDPSLYSNVTFKNYRDNSDEFFRELSSQLQAAYLTAK